MPESAAGWVVPALIVFGAAGVLVAALVWALRRAARGPRARAAADRARTAAGVRLVELDDAVAELDLESALSDTLYGGAAPTALARTKLTAQHARDGLFDDFRRLDEEPVPPRAAAEAAARIQARAGEVLALVARTRAEHSAWVRANVSAGSQIAAGRQRLAQLSASMGDPAALVAQLQARFDEPEWQAAAAHAAAATTGAADAARLLDEAQAIAADPTRSALPSLAAVERALRAAAEADRALEQTHALLLQASAAAPAELTAAREAVRQAETARARLEPDDAARLGDAVREATAALDAVEPTVVRRPGDAVARIARVRDRLDAALGDARAAQARLRGARTALPGALAVARGALARAEAAVAASRAADARVRLASARQQLSDAEQSADPVDALDAARRAGRDADDAVALADYARLGLG